MKSLVGVFEDLFDSEECLSGITLPLSEGFFSQPIVMNAHKAVNTKILTMLIYGKFFHLSTYKLLPFIFLEIDLTQQG